MENIITKPTPNYTTGRSGNRKPELVVIHVMDGTLKGTDSWFASAASQVSAHYGIGLDGEVHQYVKEENTAWHAGRVKNPSFSLYKEGVNPNAYTIGIEHEGKANSEWTPAMKAKSAALIREICLRWNIPVDREHIIGHYQIFSEKPNCPALNKGIIDELIAMAKPAATPAPSVPSDDSKVAKATALLEEALNILKS